MKTPEDILAELQPIFRETLDLDDLTLTPATTAEDVEEWDSLAHIQLIMAMSRHFGIRFTTQEMTAWRSVADIITSIQGHLS